MRPGVPTTMSAPARIRCTCMKRLTPPRMATMRASLSAERAQAFLDLQCEFACRRQDQGTCAIAMRLATDWRPGAAASAGQKRRSCRCRSGRRRADRVRRAGEEWRLPGSALVEGNAPGRGRAAEARPGRVSAKVFNDTKIVAPALATARPCLRQKASALMFACPRDNGANALRLRFREGTSSQFGPDANHAFTEWRSISPMCLPVQGRIGWRASICGRLSRNFLFAWVL